MNENLKWRAKGKSRNYFSITRKYFFKLTEFHKQSVFGEGGIAKWLSTLKLSQIESELSLTLGLLLLHVKSIYSSV